MLFERELRQGLLDGSVTTALRRWKRPQVVAGGRYRLGAGAGLVEAVAVDVVEPPDPDGRSLYRIEFRVVDGPDPRDVLAAADGLSTADVAHLDRRLARLDRASPRGPWTRAVLDAIATSPAVRAADLAAGLGRGDDVPAFKLDVRKLKALGLTISLERGYRLSPRGEAYLAATATSGTPRPATDR